MKLPDFPDEVLVDIFSPLDRASLDKLQRIYRRFHHFIHAEMSCVCLRPLVSATLDLWKYKTYVVELERVHEAARDSLLSRVKPNKEHFCACHAFLNKEHESAHLVSDWLIRKKGLTKLKSWKPVRECSTTRNTPQWCEEGRPLHAEDLRLFFEENFQRVYRAPRGDCLTYCSGSRKSTGEHFTHVYYGTRTHCEVGVGTGAYVGASHYEYYVDRDQHFHQVTDTCDKAVGIFFAALRSSVVLNEVRISQIVLSETFAEILEVVGPTVRILGAFSVSHTDTRAVAPINLVNGFAATRVINFKDSTFTSGSLDDAFLLHCIEAEIPSVVLPECPAITEDLILRYCFEHNAVNLDNKYARVTSSYFREPDWRVLRLSKPTVSSEFLRNLIKACRACEHETKVMLVVLDMKDFQEQIDWAFHGNRLNAWDVDHWEHGNFPQYRFNFQEPNDVRIKLDWCSSINALVLRRTKIAYGREEFLHFKWNEL